MFFLYCFFYLNTFWHIFLLPVFGPSVIPVFIYLISLAFLQHLLRLTMKLMLTVQLRTTWARAEMDPGQTMKLFRGVCVPVIGLIATHSYVQLF